MTLDELAREGARRMIAAALEAEVAEYVERFVEERGEDGKRLVVRNRRGPGAQDHGRVGDRPDPRPTRRRPAHRRRNWRTSALQLDPILPAYARRSPKVNDVLPVLYLRSLSTGDFRPALEQLLGEDAAGLSPSTIPRLCKEGWPG